MDEMPIIQTATPRDTSRDEPIDYGRDGDTWGKEIFWTAITAEYTPPTWDTIGNNSK